MTTIVAPTAASLVPPIVKLTLLPTDTVLAAVGLATSMSPAAEAACVIITTPFVIADAPILPVIVASPVVSAPLRRVFVEVGRAVLAVAKYHERTSGEPKTLAELLRIVADLEGAHLHLRERTSRESLAYLRECVPTQEERAKMAGFLKRKEPQKVKPSFARQAQREARKVRKAAKVRRGW